MTSIQDKHLIDIFFRIHVDEDFGKDISITLQQPLSFSVIQGFVSINIGKLDDALIAPKGRAVSMDTNYPMVVASVNWRKRQIHAAVFRLESSCRSTLILKFQSRVIKIDCENLCVLDERTYLSTIMPKSIQGKALTDYEFDQISYRAIGDPLYQIGLVCIEQGLKCDDLSAADKPLVSPRSKSGDNQTLPMPKINILPKLPTDLQAMPVWYNDIMGLQTVQHKGIHFVDYLIQFQHLLDDERWSEFLKQQAYLMQSIAMLSEMASNGNSQLESTPELDRKIINTLNVDGITLVWLSSENFYKLRFPLYNGATEILAEYKSTLLKNIEALRSKAQIVHTLSKLVEARQKFIKR